MTQLRVFITDVGIVSPLGAGLTATAKSLQHGTRALTPLSRFPLVDAQAQLVGEILDPPAEQAEWPMTHRLAWAAVQQISALSENPPDAIVIGTTTGGMPDSECRIRDQVEDPAAYRFHGAGTVAALLAEKLGCNGPVLTVSTACSSGASAIKLALELIRNGLARRVLAGGADGLCRFIYHGFNSLQLLDPEGCRPLDTERQGMSIGEAAAFVLLEGSDSEPEGALACISGGGLSCDAHHATAPHPEGEGAQTAMQAALTDAGLTPENVDYVNLHGTGTPNNDQAEGRAVARLFGARALPVSSIKGMTGHSLGAAGAMEAVVSALCIKNGFLPANIGLNVLDPELQLDPLRESQTRPINTVLSNSFGFGGNNAALVVQSSSTSRPIESNSNRRWLRILGASCLTAQGDLDASLAAIEGNESLKGLVEDASLTKNLPPRQIRRLKRLSRLVMALAMQAKMTVDPEQALDAIYFGTAWGPLSETHDFLIKLFNSGEKLASPTDFIGSVHNAPAGQAALLLSAKGHNVTLTGGDTSFEQAVLSATLLAEADKPLCLIGADEYHPTLSPRFDESFANESKPSDGGGSLLLVPSEIDSGLRLGIVACLSARKTDAIAELIRQLGGVDTIVKRYGALVLNIPAADRESGQKQKAAFLQQSGFSGPVWNLRDTLGQHPAAGAIATALCSHYVQQGQIPTSLCEGGDLQGRGILLLTLGKTLTALEILP